MPVETVLSIATLGAFIWVVRYLLPKAVKERDSMALACAVLTAIVALLMWLLIGVGTRSISTHEPDLRQRCPIHVRYSCAPQPANSDQSPR